MLQRNLKLFKQKCPTLYDTFKDYKPTKENPMLGVTKEACVAQAETWLNNPTRIAYEIGHLPSEISLHLDLINDIYTRRKEDVGNTPINEVLENKLADTVCMLGVGNGHHLVYLLENITINNLILYEPDADVFYSSLDQIDWSPILDKTNVELAIGGGMEAFINRTEGFLRKAGRFHAARLYLYRHYDSQATRGAERIFKDNYHKLISGWGFFEDEIQGIQHSRVNMVTSPAILAKSDVPNIPVFIVGNGPSLDKSIEYLKDNAGGALVVSCGTSTPSLLANGIKPDIHVEMERVYTTKKWIESCDQLDEFTSIPLVHNNTVHPAVVGMFDNTYMVLKPNDTGANILNDGEHLMPLHSNPTCVNLALATVIGMGFRELYFFGLDCGFRDASDHHSKASSYYKEGFEGKDKMEYKAQFERPANFGGTVFSERIYDICRTEIELLLHKNPQVGAFNCSDGALIHGAIPCEYPPSLDYWWTESREHRILELLDDNSSMVKEKNFGELFYEDLRNEVYNIEFSEEYSSSSFYIRTIDRFIGRLNQIYQKIAENTGDQLYLQSLLIGSFNYISTVALSNLYYYKDDAKRWKFIYWLDWIIECHFQSLENKLQTNYDKVDTTFEGWY